MTLQVLPKKRTRRAYKIDGKRCPTQSGIKNNIGWGNYPLQWWANKMGLEGHSLQEAFDLATKPGSIVHAMIEAHLWNESGNGEKANWKDLINFKYSKKDVDVAENSFLNFLEWTEQFAFKPLIVEPELISHKYGYGTTPDTIGTVNGKLALIDWKSGKIYESTLVQLAANQIAWEENYPDKPLEGGFYVLRIPRNEDVPAFHFSHWGKLPDEAWEAFELAKRLGEIEKILKTYM